MVHICYNFDRIEINSYLVNAVQMNKPIVRAQLETVLSDLREYPAVALLGPRQCGKTTLAKSLGGSYFDLEKTADQVRLDLEWDETVKAKQLVILDEAHALPEVFPRLRSAVDKDRERNGRFLLLGSISPVLMRNVSQSLAGRIAYVDLTPFLYHELPHKAAQRLWLMGGFPKGGVLEPRKFVGWQRNYLRSLAQRDLPAWGLAAKPITTMRLFSVLGAAHGSIWNASQVGSALGLSYHTINDYVDFLEGVFLIRRVMPFASSVRKRIFKRPKIYWRDSGLLHYLLKVASIEDLFDAPQAGRSWESFVIEQILCALDVTGRTPQPYFWHTSNRAREIDLVLEFGREKWAVEIKLTASPNTHDMAALNASADIIGAKRRFLVSNTREVIEAGDKVSCNLPWLAAKILAKEI